LRIADREGCRVSLLNAFLATWSHARKTFGQSAPAGGAQFDQSARLRQMQSDVEGAAPAAHWQGGAATAYAARNDEHAEIFGKLAHLDTRLAAEIDKSAEVVAYGRADLDNVRDWVVSAASSVPNNQAGQTMLMSIVSKGMGDLSEVVLKSNGELNAIGANIQQIGEEYAGLSNQKLAGRGPLPQNPPSEDDLPLDETTWYAEWEALNREVSENNAAVNAHLRRRPPPNSPLIGPWNAQAAVLRANADRLYQEQLTKVAEAAEIGISAQAPPPPVTIDVPTDTPYGTVPSGLLTPNTGASNAGERSLPA
jgi:EspA-like secreted protein